MSNINLSVSHERIIPRIESSVFSDNPDAKYAVGVLAVGDLLVGGLEQEYLGYLKLRANVYANQTNMIPLDLVNEDGTESDEDDERAVHFAVIENNLEFARVVASMRLIIKSEKNDRNLPIESFFSSAFPEPAPIGSIEVSRYICRHETKKTQRDLKWPLYRSVLAYITQNRFSPTYGVVEPILEKGLAISGVPIKRIAEPQYVEEYSTDNLAIEIDTTSLARNMGVSTETTDNTLSQFEFFGELDTRGLDRQDR